MKADKIGILLAMVMALIFMIPGVAFAGKILATDLTQYTCILDSNTVSSTGDAVKGSGQGRFCTKNTVAQIVIAGDKVLGFGEGVANVTPGFVPPAGSTEYAVEPGDAHFWAVSVKNTGTVPADGEIRDRYPQDATVTNVFYVKGLMPVGQLPWSTVIASADASINWSLPANNGEVIATIRQAPPGDGYVVFLLQRKPTPTPAPTVK